jgi:hypothetical protein
MYRTLLLGLASIALAHPAGARPPIPCPTEPYDVILPAGLSQGDQYGASVAVLDDWLFVGAPMDDQLGTDAGAVNVFQIDGGMYEFRQKLLASGGVGAARFGFSVAADGDVLLIGAETDGEVSQSNPNAWGAAYVFRLQGNAWVQQQKLFAFDAGQARQFGWAVTTLGNVAVVGARQVVNDGVNSKGAAYIYRFNGTNWLQEQRLTSDVPSQLDLFGTALALTPDTLLIGSPGNDDLSTNAGTVFVFAHNGVQWMQQTKLYALDGFGGDQFGTQIAFNDGHALVAAPMHDAVAANSGAVYAFAWDGSQWITGNKLFPPNGAGGDQFGLALSIRGASALIGSPNRNHNTGQFTYFQAGAAYVYRLSVGLWQAERMLATTQEANTFGYGPAYCWLYGPQPTTGWPQSLNFVRLGLSSAVSPLGFISGSSLVRSKCWEATGIDTTGAVYLFADQFSFPDCNLNGIPDECDPAIDCNGNYVPDSCEVATMKSGDCNSNAVPDECESGFRYQLDPGFASQSFYVNPTTGNADFIWLNQLRVKNGGQVLTHIGLQAIPFLPPGAPIKVMVYGDPTQDGNPSDAVLLTSATTTAVSHDSTTEFFRMAYAAIQPTYVGEPDTFFFIAAVVQPPTLNDNFHPWTGPCAALGSHPLRRSWRAFAPPGQADIHNLTNNASPIQLWTSGPFVLRGVAADCNGNGAWDACEIAAGEVPDVNGNGVPDSCEAAPCVFADIAPSGGDGEVNIFDLLHVITNWGVCNPCFAICPGDTNDDCAINVSDLLAVITGWGRCE